MAMKNICHTKLIQLISEVARMQDMFPLLFWSKWSKSRPFLAHTGSQEWHSMTFSHFQTTFQPAGICTSPVVLGSGREKPIFSSSSMSGWSSSQVEVNHGKPESLPHVLNLVRPLTELCRKLNEELKEKQKAKKKESPNKKDKIHR